MTPCNRHPIRGRVYLMHRLPSGKAVWAYEARVGHNVYLQDDTCDHAKIMADCITAVAALRRIYAAGHRLTYTYPELVAVEVTATRHGDTWRATITRKEG